MSEKKEYPQSHSIYGKWYGVSERSIRSWVTVGRHAGDFPPLDDPLKMPDWWSRNQKRSIPNKIFEAPKVKARMEAESLASSELGQIALESEAVSGPSDADSEDSAPKKIAENGKNKERESARREFEAGGWGISARLERLATVEGELCAAYFEVLKNDNAGETEIARAQKRWTDAAEALRKLEKDAPEILKQRGELLVRSEVCEAVQRAHGAIRSAIETLLRRVRPRLEGLDERAQSEVWDCEVQAMFREMDALEFGLGAEK